MYRQSRAAAFYLILVFALVVAACSPPSSSDTHRKIVIISLDGMADWILDYLLENDQLPNIRRVLSHGVAAETALTTFPAKTAVGHASIWTGTDPSHNGIHSNSIIAAPYGDKTVLDETSGFDSTGLQAEPIWAAAARQGKKAVVVQATQCQPFDYFLGDNARFPAPRENLLIFDGYGVTLLPPEVIEPVEAMEPADGWTNLPESFGAARSFSREVGDETLHFLFFDDPQDPVDGLDSLRICSNKDVESTLALLKPRPPNPDSAEGFSPPLNLTVNGSPTKLYFRLFSLSPDGSDFTLFHSQAHYYRSSDPNEEEKMNAQSGGFVGNAAVRLYSKRFFGPVVLEGGDGAAERAFLETVRHSVDRFKAAIVHALNSYEFDLLVGYLPYPDEFNHIWLGFVADSADGFDQPRGEKIKPYIIKGYQMIDEYVGAVFDNLPEDAILFIVSDHGFFGVEKQFFPNVALRKAGLLFTDDEGMIDLSRTKAVYYPHGNDLVFVNTEEFKEGIVPVDQKGEILAEVERAFLAVEDEQGDRIVEEVIYPAEDKELGMDGPYAGDLYIRLAPGYGNNESPLGDELYRNLPAPEGDHFGDPRVRRMNSIFLAGSKTGGIDAELGLVRSIDIAPTIASLLGIAPPRQATGGTILSLVRTIEKTMPN